MEDCDAALPETAGAYLDILEAEALAALARSEQKAVEAKLIRARQERFRAAMDMLGGKVAAGRARTDPLGIKPVRRRGRRPIREMQLHSRANRNGIGAPGGRRQVLRNSGLWTNRHHLPHSPERARRRRRPRQIPRSAGRIAINQTWEAELLPKGRLLRSCTELC